MNGKSVQIGWMAKRQPSKQYALCIARRVARWYIFKPKISIWVNFGGPLNGKVWYSLWPFGIYYCHSVHFMAIG
jgi:hypothetical protein